MIIICSGGEKRLINSLNQFGKVDRSIINGKMLHEALFNSRGEVRKKLLERSNLLQTKINVNPSILPPAKSDLFTDKELLTAVNQLKQDNFSRLGTIHDLPIFKDLLKALKLPSYPSNEMNALQKIDVKSKFWDQPDPKIDFMWNVQPELLWDNSAFRFILEDSFWMRISDSFFHGHSKISGFNMWHSFPHNKESRSPENWHRDANDGCFFIKFFILLTDVSLANGPTAFVPIPIEHLPTKFLSGRRYSDNEIEQLCKKRDVNPIYATGRAGTIYVGDTRGIHRGTPVLSGHRSIINFRVSIDHQFGINNSEKYNIPSTKFKSSERFSIF